MRLRRIRIVSLTALTMVFLLMLGAVSLNGQGASNSGIIKSLNFQGADIKLVLNQLADYGQVNIVTAPTVDAIVTLSLSDVTWKQALDIVMKTYGLTAVQEKGYMRVLPTKQWMEESRSLQQHQADHASIVQLESRIIDVDHASAPDLVVPIQSLLTKRGTVEVDARTNALIVQDIPDNLSIVESFVRDLDRETPQIKISAQLVEVSSSALEEIGINWDIKGSKTNTDGTSYNHNVEMFGAEDVADPITQFTFGTVQDGWELHTKIAALLADGKGKIIAHPEITTIDNLEAKIQMGQKIPVKQFDGSGNVVIIYEEVGTILKVTPHITSESRVLMHLKPERSTYEFDPNGLIINTNNAETNVVVDNGQTAVIGGLTTQDLIENESGIPVLKDLPILGYLFKYRKKRVENRDLIIFVTPTIVESSIASTTDNP